MGKGFYFQHVGFFTHLFQFTARNPYVENDSRRQIAMLNNHKMN